MNASRILPDLQCALLCEDIRQEVNGNFILVGVLGLLRVPQVPLTVLRFCLFTRWTAGVGQFTESVRLIAPDQTTVLRKGQVKFALENPAQHSTNVIVLPQVQLATDGVYQVEVLVDEVMKLRFPLPVMVVPPPTAQGAPPSAADKPEAPP